ncbi:hypothetical protein GF312_16820 [Candidatus Poribacteria bacterium]|nr:hypothetical protein [Candidatus Poribacteria bacterium]
MPIQKIAVFILTFTIALSFFCQTSKAEEDEAKEILIGNQLWDIAMDEDYVWIATDKGVNRYDRNNDQWKFYTISDGLINNQVNCIAPERVEGLLTTTTGDEVWFGTDSGVSVYTKSTDSWKSYTKKDGLIYNRINCISARGNDVWIGTDKGVSVYDKKDNKWQTYTKFPKIKTTVVTAVYHQASYAWIGTYEGLIRYNYRYKKWEYFTNIRGIGSRWLSPEGGPRETDDSPIPDDRINAIDGDGRYVYIATKGALAEFDSRVSLSYQTERNAYRKLGRARRTARTSRFNYRGTRASSLLQMARDRSDAWEGMGWRHISIMKLMGAKKFQVTDNFLDVKSRSGETWVATNKGLLRFDSWVGERQIFTKENGLIDDEVTTIATIGSEVWAGTAHGLGTYNLYTRNWKSFKMEKALPSSYVTALAEDIDGVWFGTRGAVSRFNPQNERWKTYTRNEGLAGNNVFSIAVVGNFVWFGTDEGVSRLNKTTKGWDNFNTVKSNLASNLIKCILVDGKYVWVGTNEGLNRYDDTTGVWETFSTSFGLLDNRINALAADPGYVWVGTNAGLNRYDKSTGKWNGYTTAEGLSNNVINSIDLDDKKIWVGTRLGLNVMDRKTKVWESHTNKLLYSIAVDGDDVWLGGRGEISLYNAVNGNSKTFDESDAEGITRVNIYGIKNTPEYVWFATDGGVYRYNKADGTWWVYSPTRSRGSTDTLVDGNVHAIAGDRDFIYFGTGGGISRYDRLTNNWLSYTIDDGLVGPDVRDLMLDGPDLWIATQSGISVYDTVSDTWTNYTRQDGLPSNKVFSLIKINGKIWAGTHSGATFLEDGKWDKITMLNGLPDDHVWDIAVDNGHMWFATNNGVARYTPEKDIWLIYKRGDGLTSNVVLSVGFEDKYIFFNTTNGTTIYDRELGSFTPFSIAEGLAGNTSTAVGSDIVTLDKNAVKLEQEIWIGTYGGTTHYDIVTDTAENYTQEDGLASDKVQDVKIDGQYVWFGTDSGVSRYDTVNKEWISYGKALTARSEEQTSGLVSYNIKSLAASENYLWVGTRKGLSRYDKINGEWTQIHLGMPNPDGMTIFQERSNLNSNIQNILGNLATQSETGDINTESQMPATTNPVLRSMSLMGNFLWLGTDLGLYFYDMGGDELVWYSGNITNIKTIYVHENKAWIISDDRIGIFDRGGSFNSWTLISDTGIVEEVTSDGGYFNKKEEEFNEGIGLTNITAALVDGDNVWLGREKGLSIYSVKNKKVADFTDIPAELAEKKITALVSDNKNIWIGTRKGLYRYNTESGTWDFFDQDKGLTSDYISCITVDEKYIWVGSSNRGVSRYDKSGGIWDIFTSRDGLADDNVRAIAIDGKYVWFGTFSGGVCRYDTISELWTTFRTESYAGRPQI